MVDPSRPWFRHYEPSVPQTLVYPTFPLHEALDRTAKAWPDRIALRFFVDPKLPSSTMTYRELQERRELIRSRFQNREVS